MVQTSNPISQSTTRHCVVDPAPNLPETSYKGWVANYLVSADDPREYICTCGTAEYTPPKAGKVTAG